MKHFLFLIFTLLCPAVTFAQVYVNPDSTQLPATIYLQNTDVYYDPMAPDTNATGDSLCSVSTQLLDPNGVGTGYYQPSLFGNFIQNWAPGGYPLGPTAKWPRFFTAKRDGSGHTHDIIVGSNVVPADTTIYPGLDGAPPDTTIVTTPTGPVIVSKNEDVDFRASGTIRMEDGFHVMPGSYFHAYIEPTWGDSVFCDEFDSTSLDLTKWRVTNAHNDDYQFPANCSSDSDVRDTADPDAHDGHALDIMLVEIPDTCSCLTQTFHLNDSCNDDFTSGDTTFNRFAFSSAILRSCPFPWVTRDTTLVPAYDNAPYGKYEFREKIPHIMHHTNNWEYNAFEYDINETWNGDMSQLHPGLHLQYRYGPFKGIFQRKGGGDTTWVFRSSQPNWCLSNNPNEIDINGFAYDVTSSITPTDTFVYSAPWNETSYRGGFPYSYLTSSDSFTFYYRRSGNNVADTLTWTVDTDNAGAWRIFSAAYHVRNGDSLIFSKLYQPTQIIIKVDTGFIKKTDTITCHWVDSLNDPTNYGKIRLDNPLLSTDIHSNREAYPYNVSEGAYPAAPYGFNGLDTSGGYEYHTFAVEILPHEIRYLMDSNVMWRVPDRNIPPSSPYYDWASQLPRSPVGMHPAEVDIDENGNNYDLFGTDTTTYTYMGVTYWNSITGRERQYFDTHLGNPGMWDVVIGGKTYHAAHHLIDYVKVWDVPADVKIPPYPH